MRDLASIVGLKVIAAQEGRDLGPVTQVVVDLASGKLEGLIVGKGPLEKGIAAEDVTVIGVDAVMVETHKAARHLSELPRLMEKRRDPREGSREVLTDSGTRVGALGTIYIDPESRLVTRYEVSGGAWRDITEGVLSLPPMEGTVDGKDSVIIPSAALEHHAGSEGGLKAQLARLAEAARNQARQTSERIEETVGGIRQNHVEGAGSDEQPASEPVNADEADKPADG